MFLRKKDVNMLSGSITKGLITIALPVMVMNVIQSLFNIIDMSVLKSFDIDGGYSVGAVGVCSTLISLISGLLIGISSGSNVVIARYIGCADKERVDRATGASILFSIIGGAALAVIGISFAGLLLSVVNCPDTLMAGAKLYFRLYFAGAPILMLYNFSAAALRSAGDSTSPMIYLTVGGITKLCFNYLFVGIFKMGVTGVALATIISWSLSAALGVRALISGRGAIKLKREYFRLYKKELKDILYIGIPTGMQQALYSIANVMISATVNAFGPDATTGISIANSFDGILYHISVATSFAVMPYVSQNVGCKNIKRATQAVGRGIIITVALGSFFGFLSAAFSSELSSLMSDNPNVIAFSRQKMIIISSTYFICGINEIMGAALRSMKKPIVVLVCTMIYMCIIRLVWIYAIFPLYRNLTFLYLVWPISWVLSAVTLLFFYFPTVKKLKRSPEACELA